MRKMPFSLVLWEIHLELYMPWYLKHFRAECRDQQGVDTSLCALGCPKKCSICISLAEGAAAKQEAFCLESFLSTLETR